METEKQSFHSEKKNSYRNENNQLGILKSDSTSKKHPKIRKFTSPLKEISNNIGLMEFEDSHFVPEKEYKSILNEIKLLEGEINNLEVEKNLKQQKIKQCESDCLLNEAELKEFINDNTRLRKELEDNHNQSITFLQKNSEVEMELKKNSEKLSFAQHKVFFLTILISFKDKIIILGVLPSEN